MYALLETLVKKKNDTEEKRLQRVGVTAATVLHTTNQELDVYATKVGVMLKASGVYMTS